MSDLKHRVIRCNFCNHFSFRDDLVTYCTSCFHELKSNENCLSITIPQVFSDPIKSPISDCELYIVSHDEIKQEAQQEGTWKILSFFGW